MATDRDGNVYICSAILSRNASYASAAKYSTDGMFLWQRTSEFKVATGVATDGNGNVYNVGYAVTNVAFVTKYSTEGALRWTRQLEASVSFATGVATNNDGNAYITGSTLSGANQVDAFIAKYSPDRALRWMRQLGSSEFDSATVVATDGNGHVYISGDTVGSLGGTNRGQFDSFVAKYSTRR